MSHQWVHCAAGHRLRASSALSGQTRPCPKCGVAVEIPAVENATHPLLNVEKRRQTVSDSSFMRVLGSSPQLPDPPAVQTTPRTKPCPRCDTTVATEVNVCPHCQCYVGRLPHFLASMFKPATSPRK